MAMRATTVRFSDRVWSMLEDEAAQEGVSAAQFIREATIMRLGFLQGQRSLPDAGEDAPVEAEPLRS